ncbi:SURF1 family cytochrome oxidase biogenesis protein [Williamsia serinedens]|uniref:SURF1-like protein n=1 Tax=Williamsia serinedens TaxID=391736 RepID=A0ABT1H5W9_9NOCA|nr:SURF1 family cytochrome oxidase biogenesis protein [Williamsia serinedens]MCP2162630.1 Cytochrome oxidase assembly protein ShyY1 [Williamsia serinedens]
MRILRTFARPGWVALAVVVVAFAAACFYVLAPWQLGKNSRTEHQNSLIKSAVSKSAVPIDSVWPGRGPLPTDSEWREVTVTGRYLPADQAVVRLRSVSDAPAYEVLTPFRLDDGRVFVVNRGYVRPVDGTALPSVPSAPDGPATVSARLRVGEGTSPGRGPRVEDGALQVYTIDPAVLGRTVGLDTMPAYLQLSPDQPGSLGELPIPQLDSGPYLSYGLQWIAFGVMAPLGLGYFIVAEVRHRRAAAAAATTDSAEAGAAPPPRTEGVAARARRRREDLVSASSSGLGSSRVRSGIGFGPRREETSASAREKLTDRYGD